MKKVVILSLVVILLLAGSSSALVQQTVDCSSCHNESMESGNYVYQEPTIQVDSPMFADPSSSFTIKINVTFFDYELRRFSMELDQNPRIISFQNDSEILNEEVDMSSGRVFMLNGTPTRKGASQLTFNFSFDPYYDHPEDDENDLGHEEMKKSKPLIIGSSSLEPSTWSVYMEGEEGQFELEVKEDIKDLNIYPPEGLKTQPKDMRRVSKGSTLEVSVKNVEEKDISGSILITWEEEGKPHAISVDITSRTKKEDSISYYSLTGRITGLLALPLLGFSIILGMSKKLKDRLDWKKRVRYHCATSWILFGLSVYHGIVLLIRPYYFQAFLPGMILGYISTASMFLVSINGSFMKKISKAIGGENWRALHQYFTIIAFSTIIQHAIMMGTEFEFVRRLIGI